MTTKHPRDWRHRAATPQDAAVLCVPPIHTRSATGSPSPLKRAKLASTEEARVAKTNLPAEDSWHVSDSVEADDADADDADADDARARRRARGDAL